MQETIERLRSMADSLERIENEIMDLNRETMTIAAASRDLILLSEKSYLSISMEIEFPGHGQPQSEWKVYFKGKFYRGKSLGIAVALAKSSLNETTPSIEETQASLGGINHATI